MMRPLRHIHRVTGIALGLALLLALIPISHAQTELECEDPFIPDAAPAYYLGQAAVFMEDARYAQAIEQYSCAIERQPDYAPAYADRGFAYAQLLDRDNALADFEQALALDDTLVAIYVNRGVLYTTLGNFGLAINDYTLALALDPVNVEALNNRAIVHAIEGNYDLALQDLQTALTVAPNYAPALATQGAVYSALAAQSYQAYVEIEGEDAPLPAGTPNDVLRAVDDGLRDGNIAVWLRLHVEAR